MVYRVDGHLGIEFDQTCNSHACFSKAGLKEATYRENAFTTRYTIFLLAVSVDKCAPQLRRLKCHMKVLQNITVTPTERGAEHCYICARCQSLTGLKSHIHTTHI